MSKSVKKYIRENVDVIIQLSIMYVIGIIVGIVLFNVTGSGEEYTQVVRNSIDIIGKDGFEKMNLISNGLKNNVLFISLIYLSLITIICPTIIYTLLTCKGVVTGIYVCTLFKIFGFFKGIGVTIMSVIIPGAICLAGFILIIHNVLELFYTLKSNVSYDLKQLIIHLYYLIISISLIVFSVVIEQLFSPIVTSLYTDMI